MCPQAKRSRATRLKRSSICIAREDPDDEDDFEERLRRVRAERRLFRERLSEVRLKTRRLRWRLRIPQPDAELFDGSSMQEMGINMQDLLGGILPKRKKVRRLKLSEARRVLAQEEAGKLR